MTDTTPNEELTKLVELSVVFKNAVEEKFGQDAELTAKIQASVSPEEMEEFQNLVMRLATESFGAAFGGISEEFLKLNLKAADITADIVGRVLSKDDLAALLPEDLQNEESVTRLETEGAKNLAALCKHALSM